MSNLTHWKKNFNPNYIGAYAFDPGEEKTVTVKSAGVEEIIGEGGKKERKTVLHFEGGVKPLILNKTNARMIERVLGSPYMEQWIGKAIVLGVEKARFGSERVDAVRVKDKKPTGNAPFLCEDCGQTIAGVKKLTPEQVAAATRNAFGCVLCSACGTKRKERANAATDTDSR